MTADNRPKPARRRRLSEEEIDLWLSVAATVRRRPGAILPDPASEPAAMADRPPPAPPKPRPMPYAAPYRPAPQAPVPKMAPLERKLKQRLSRGRMGADAAIDLHGFRQAEAHSALRHFLHQAQGDGARIVLIVTGKGSRGGDPLDPAGGVGVLKRSVPLWLAEPDLRAIVIGFEDAGRAHGGTGALYVRLRRRGG
jgi:DNA-nicking Smr family endonuclease